MADEVLRWAEISPRCERERFAALSEELTASGKANEVSFLEVSDEEFQEFLKHDFQQFDQIRIGGHFGELLYRSTTQMPSALLPLKTADAYVRERVRDGDEGFSWWPRNFLAEGIQRAFANDVDSLDLSGGVFVFGHDVQARAAVSALTRIGFSRFSMSSLDEESGQRFVEEMRASYFKVQFQFVPRHMVTQLPGVHSVAVNAIRSDEDEGSMAELSFFNFLRPSGVWLDLPLIPFNASLESEAKNVGALVLPGIRVAELTDQVWARQTLGAELDLKRYRSTLARHLGR